ncbi:flagellar protein FlaG [Cytobacillus sp. FJAT-54145]|uniref:Flagellar protein FlaG n=1 Tax=Cytobacillus spartinae TaxID=3299023 RepID=A0ABW6KG38_9BACI
MIDRVQSAPIYSSQPRTVNHEGKIPLEPLSLVQDSRDTTENKNPQPKEKVEEIVSSLNKFLQPTHTSLKFEFHEKLKEYYVAVVDDQTKEIVKEIPARKLLDFYAAMTEHIGLLVDKKI